MSHQGLHRVADRFAWHCHYCGRRLHCATCDPAGVGLPATRDHVIPRSKGGKGSENLVAACPPCNIRKADLLPGETKKRRDPTPGCHGSRSGTAARRMRPFKPFPTLELAEAMCEAVNTMKGTDLIPWACPYCNQWHIALRQHIRESTARGPWRGLQRKLT